MYKRDTNVFIVFLNGIIYFLMHYSMQFYILYVKLLNHLQQKVINL